MESLFLQNLAILFTKVILLDKFEVLSILDIGFMR